MCKIGGLGNLAKSLVCLHLNMFDFFLHISSGIEHGDMRTNRVYDRLWK